MRTLLCLFAFMVTLSLAHPDSVLAQTLARLARKVVTRVNPDYPDFFRNGHFEGRIVAEATVLPNGSISSVEVKAGTRCSPHLPPRR